MNKVILRKQNSLHAISSREMDFASHNNALNKST